MKLKYWLVVLLALILPVKGAMATAGMLCHVPASQHVQSSHGSASHDMHQEHAVARALEASDAATTHHGTAADTHEGSVVTSCLACAAVCGASPLPPKMGTALPAFEAARDWRGLALVAPPSLTLAGLERPPRSI